MRHKDRHLSEDHGPHGHHRARGRGGRAQRGDIRAAVLLILADGPAHGYQLMQTMADRTGGAWRPSPGAVYPALAQLEADGLLTIEEEGGRRLARLTADGRAYVQDTASPLADPFTELRAPRADSDLRRAADQLQVAAQAVAATGSPEQAAASAEVLEGARRALYRILAG